MKWEHKIGIALTCTFLCLVGAVLGLKMREPAPTPSPTVATTDPAEAPPSPPEVKIPISFEDEKPLPNVPDDPRSQASHRSAPPDSDVPHRPPVDFFTRNKGAREDGPSGKNETPSMRTREKAVSDPPHPVEKPAAPPVIGAGEWNRYPGGSGGKKATPSPLPSPEVKKNQKENQPVPSGILPTSATEPPTPQPDSQIKPIPAPASPVTLTSPVPGTGSTPTPPAPSNSTIGASPPAPAMPAYLSQQPTKAASTVDPKPMEKGTSSATAAPVKQPEMPKVSSDPTPAPPPSMMPSIASPTPAPPAPPPTTTPAPALAPAPIRLADPSPAPTPTPVPPAAAPTPPAAAPTPPKPPAEGSTFIPDRPSAAPGPVGVKPEPLPFPVPPPSSPLASAPEKPAPPPRQPASAAPSVTVYDEQDYSCKSGDTWAEISKHFYMTDRYAKALQRHNQNHARASERVRDTGQLASGERIFIPQAYVLEERYADAIPKPAAAPASGAMPVAYPSGSQPPAPPAPPAPPRP